ncbi:MAG TPA: polysaccharide biosynthesis tyrosine autokinase [Longimicrobiaceae bacterium]
MSQHPEYRAEDPLDWNPRALPAGDEAGQLRALAAGVARRWWLVALGLAAGLGCAAYFAVDEEPEFRSTATIWVPQPAADGSPLGGIGSLMGLGGGGASLSELELIRSRALGGEVVDSLGLRLQGVKGSDLFVDSARVEPGAPGGTLVLAFGADGVRADAGTASARAPYGRLFRVAGVRLRVPRHPGVERAEFRVVSRDDAIGRFQENVMVGARDRTTVVDVGITAPSPKIAERSVNLAVDLLRSSHSRRAEAVLEERGRRLRAQIAFNDSSLRAAQAQLAGFRSAHETYNSGDLFRAREAERMGLETELAELRESRAAYAALLEGLRSPGAAQERGLDVFIASPGVMGQPLISQLYGAMAQYQTQRDSMTAGRWGRPAGHPDVARVDELIAETRRRLVGAAGSALQALDAQIAGVERRRAQTQAKMQPLPAADAREEGVLRQIEGLSRMSLMLREEYTRQQLATGVDSIRVMDRALPGWRVEANLLQVLVLGIFGGLVVGVGGAAVLTTLDSTLRTASDTESLLGLPVLSVVPGERGRSGALAAPGGRAGEAYRTLRTNLRFSRMAADARVLAVTSAGPGEGRTTVAANLAATVARQGARVLLVDCDLARARLHAVFATDRTPGLTDLLLGDVGCDAAIRPTQAPSLDLLPAGSPVGLSASEVLESGALQGTLAELAGRYDLVVLDIPPVLADTAGSASVAAAADAVLLVVRAGRTGREPARLAVRQLAAVRARIAGAVLNDARSGARPEASPGTLLPPRRAGVPVGRIAADRADRAIPGPRG